MTQEEFSTPRLICTGFSTGETLFSKKLSPSQGREIYCTACDSCELFKCGKCLCREHKLFGWTECKFGEMKCFKGPTKRAKSYHKFKTQFTDNPLYQKLNEPGDRKLFRVNGYIGFCLSYVGWDESMQCLTNPSFGDTGFIFVPEKNFTNTLIYQICTFRPQAMLGGEIKDYQRKKVPDFLYRLKTYLPDVYERFITEYPDFTLKEVNHVGKKAYIKTLRKGCVINGFTFDGEYLFNSNYYINFFFIDNAKTEVRVKVTDDMLVRITDNSQVDENTRFE